MPGPYSGNATATQSDAHDLRDAELQAELEAETQRIVDKAGWPVSVAQGFARNNIQARREHQKKQAGHSAPHTPQRQHPDHSRSADAAAEKIAQAVQGFFEAVKAGRNPQHLVACDMGVGKTSQTIKALVRFCAANPEHRFLVRVPTHKLADQWEADIITQGIEAGQRITVGVYRGVNHTRPDGTPMCQRAADVVVVQRAGGEVADVCGSPKRGYCPHHPRAGGECLFREQSLRAKQIALVAGDVSLARPVPVKTHRSGLEEEGTEVAERHFNAIIIDETSPTDLLKGGAAEGGAKVGLDILTPRGTFEAMPGEALWSADADAARLERVTLERDFERLRRVLEAVEEGHHPTVGDIRKAGFTLESLATLRNVVWSYKPDKAEREGAHALTGTALADALADAIRRQRDVTSVVALLKALGQALADAGDDQDANRALPQVLIRRSIEKSGSRVVADLATRMELADFMNERPVLILDATPVAALLRRWYTNLEQTCEARAADGAGVFRIQVVDSEWTYDSAVPSAKRPKRERAAMNRLARASAWAFASARGGAPGFIGPKDAVEAAKEVHLLDGAITGHFGALRGINDFQQAASLVIYSRPLPSTTFVERAAAVIAGKPISETVADGLPLRPGEILMRNGMARQTTERSHPAPEADLLIEAVTRSERRQAEARSRAVRRGVDSPCVITLLGDGSIERPADHVATYQEWRAATHAYSLAFLLLGFVALSRGAPELLETVQNALLQGGTLDTLRNGSVNPDNLYKYIIEDIRVDDDVASTTDEKGDTPQDGPSPNRRVSDRWNAALRDNPKLEETVDAIHDAFRNQAPARIMGLEFPTTDFHPLAVAVPGARYSVVAMVQAATPAEAIQRIAGLLPAAKVTHAEKLFANWREKTRGQKPAKPSSQNEENRR